MPDQDRRAESPVVDHLVEVRHVMPRAVRPFIRPVALAMPALVERQHVKIADECRRDEVPPMRVRGAAVQKQHRPLAFATVVKAVQREPVGCEAMLFIGRCEFSSLNSKPPRAAHLVALQRAPFMPPFRVLIPVHDSEVMRERTALKPLTLAVVLMLALASFPFSARAQDCQCGQGPRARRCRNQDERQRRRCKAAVAGHRNRPDP